MVSSTLTGRPFLSYDMAIIFGSPRAGNTVSFRAIWFSLNSIVSKSTRDMETLWVIEVMLGLNLTESEISIKKRREGHAGILCQ